MNILESLSDSIRGRVKKDEFEVWFKRADFISFKDGTLVLRVPNIYHLEFIRENFEHIIIEELSKLSSIPPENISINYRYPPPSEGLERRPETLTPDAKNFNEPVLNPKMNFANFVVGPFNNFAHSVSLAVSKEPGKKYNPLVIYGGIGLGKTHLLNSIGHEIIDNFSDYAICYISAEDFLNEFRKSLLGNKIDQFHYKYRYSYNIFLMDDFQFLEGKKESIHNELISLFNSYYLSSRQLVFATDTPLNELKNINKKLLSRLESGLQADIKIPDIETKINIINRKAELENIQIPMDVSRLIARTSTNIRELEGKVLRLAACANFYGEKITLPFCKKTLKDIFLYKENEDAEKIKEVVCNYFDIKISDLYSRKKKGIYNTARQITIYLIKKYTNMTLSNIGDIFGGKEHSTIIHSIKSIERKLSSDSELQNAVNNIEENLSKFM